MMSLTNFSQRNERQHSMSPFQASPLDGAEVVR